MPQFAKRKPQALSPVRIRQLIVNLILHTCHAFSKPILKPIGCLPKFLAYKVTTHFANMVADIIDCLGLIWILASWVSMLHLLECQLKEILLFQELQEPISEADESHRNVTVALHACGTFLAALALCR